MNKSDSTPDISRVVLLTYGTWLVIGGWLIYTGAESIYREPNGDNPFVNYLFGVIRLVAGANAWRTAKSVALKSIEPESSFIRLMTLILITTMFVLPLVLFIFQTAAILFAAYEPGELYSGNIMRLLTIAICYMLAIVYADWRLRK